MIIDYDHSPSASYERKLQSLKESVQMALNEVGSGSTTIIYQKNQGGGGSSGTNNYNDLINKPRIEGVTLQGNKDYEDLNLERLTNSDIESALTL